MALCVRNNIEPRTPGEEGLQDRITELAPLFETTRWRVAPYTWWP
jgi:hypothetical protein